MNISKSIIVIALLTLSAVELFAAKPNPPKLGEAQAHKSFANYPKLDTPNFDTIAPHPRILLTPKVRDAIAEEIKTNPKTAQAHNTFIKRAREIMKEGIVQRKDEGFRMIGGAKLTTRFMLWGYAWKMTGDKSFAERAEREIQNLKSFKDWNPKHYLDTAAMAIACAIAYDWFYDVFSQETKNFIASEIRSKCIDAFYAQRFGWFWGKNVNNWNQVCCAGILCAATAIRETDPKFYDEVLKDMLVGITKGMDNCFSKKGMYYEGTAYWNYAAIHQIWIEEILKSAFGTDCGIAEKYPQANNSAKCVLHMVGPNGLAFSYSDSGEKFSGTNLLKVYGKRINLPDSSVLKLDVDAKNETTPMCYILNYNYKILPTKKDELVWDDANQKVPIFLARTAWNKDAMYVGIKGGKASSSHGHMDGGSFVFDANGERWAFDLGAQKYFSLEKLGMQIWNFKQNSDRWKVFRYNNFSHNIITTNNELLKTNGFAKITKTWTSPEKLGAEIEITPLYTPTLKRAQRSVIIENKEKLSVRDTIENGENKTHIRWNLCTYKDIKSVDENSAMVTAKSGKKILVKLLAPKDFKLKILPCESGNEWDAKNPDKALLGFEGYLAPKQKTEIHVEIIPQK